MAVVSIWHRDSNADGLIDYIANPDKTNEQLDALFNYTMDEKKTHKQLYVSGVNCEPETAAKEFIEVKKRWGKDFGYTAWHAIQSFRPGETDPETAHQIGLEFAQAVWGDRFQVVVTTHLDKEHLHNHFAINSVSWVDGKKYNRTKAEYRKLKSANDQLCTAYGLDVISPPQGKLKVRDKIKQDVDAVLSFASTYEDFKKAMEKLGYAFRDDNRKHMAIRPPGSTRYIRFRTLGPEYVMDGLERRLRGETPFEAEPVSYKYKSSYVRPFEFYRPKHPAKNLSRRYLRIMALQSTKGKYNASHLPPKVQRSVKSLNRLAERLYWLKGRKLTKLSEVIAYSKIVDKKRRQLMTERQNCYRLLRMVPDDELQALRQRIDVLSAKIRVVYHEARMAEAIMSEYPYLNKRPPERDKLYKQSREENVNQKQRSEPQHEYHYRIDRSR